MEPTSLILGAIIAGSTEALKETTSQAIKDSYNGLKTMVVHYWEKNTQEKDEIDYLLKKIEKNPDTFSLPLEKELQKNIPSIPDELVEKAQELQKLIDEDGFNQGKYNVTLNSCKGVQVGDKNIQNNTF